MIVSSTIVSDSIQADGRRWIRELHLDDLGNGYPVMYLAESRYDAETAMKARARQIELDLASQAAELIVRTAVEAKVSAVLKDAVTKGALVQSDLTSIGR